MAHENGNLCLSSADGEERVNIVEGIVEDVNLPEVQDRHVITAAGAPGPGRLSWRGVSLITAAVMLGVAGCWVLAAITAAAEGGEEDAAVPARALSAEEIASLASASAGAALVGGCRTALKGEPCHRHVTWAMEQGIREHKDWYPGLTVNSSFEDFQDFHVSDPAALCTLACREQKAVAQGEAVVVQAAEADGPQASSAVLGYQSSGRIVAEGQWCSVSAPQDGWGLWGCGNGNSIDVKVLTYNLYWWNLFRQRGGNGGSAGRLISSASGDGKFDVMGFQECEGVGWVLGDAGLADQYGAITGPHGMCMAYRKETWNLLANGAANVGEDRSDQWYGTRAAMWARLQHWSTGQVLFFVNHHGPLPVQSGGRCGGEATAYNILKLIADSAYTGDAVILVGDFNAQPSSATIQTLDLHMHRIYTGSSFGGVDNIFSSCNSKVSTRNLGSGGSDHDALETIIKIQ